MQGRTPDNPISDIIRPKRNKRNRVATKDEQRLKGRQLIALSIAQGMSVNEAVDHVRRQEILRNPTTFKLPSRSTVMKWYQSMNLKDLVLNEPTIIERESERERALTRYKIEIAWWRAQKADLECRLIDESDPDKMDEIRNQISKCNTNQIKYEEKLIQILHLDKDAPLERLDEDDMQDIVLKQIGISLDSFSDERLEQGLDMFAKAIEFRKHKKAKDEEGITPAEEMFE